MPAKGQKMSEEQKIKIGLSNKGKRHTDEFKKQKSESQLGSKNHNYGKHLSEETKNKIRARHKGRIVSEEQRKKISASLSGKNHPYFGKTRSDETRKKMSAAQSGSKHAMFGKQHRADSKTKILESLLGGFWYGNVRYYEGPQYCEKWTDELRERVRAYFGYQCVECGTLQTNKKLSVHHVWYNKRLCCDNTPRSLVPLCPVCHNATTNGDHEYWSNHFQEMIDTYYGGRCWLTREEFAQLKHPNP